uniref:Uncharacterized protein n=1 Tax=Chromera velia CCMP2878 TaxID=1169474 RepID=A0A0G4HED0_9ALVE|eukprot:Cvel_26588.t1-p1 / transcript=Cvel_26588.t1 / gene=Cvel_26588 / organism=Chromera_velia_CCMP2878 / gene_product=hypothetical protein / transcript_product=hypothetical protein / location=Cvel_scaffold3184:14434-15606(+) / protein_length=391 / sequence_SO=supercontig / SO=protein_coding / is_pseudo=false
MASSIAALPFREKVRLCERLRQILTHAKRRLPKDTLGLYRQMRNELFKSMAESTEEQVIQMLLSHTGGSLTTEGELEIAKAAGLLPGGTCVGPSTFSEASRDERDSVPLPDMRPSERERIIKRIGCALQASGQACNPEKEGRTKREIEAMFAMPRLTERKVIQMICEKNNLDQGKEAAQAKKAGLLPAEGGALVGEPPLRIRAMGADDLRRLRCRLNVAMEGLLEVSSITDEDWLWLQEAPITETALISELMQSTEFSDARAEAEQSAQARLLPGMDGGEAVKGIPLMPRGDALPYPRFPSKGLLKAYPPEELDTRVYHGRVALFYRMRGRRVTHNQGRLGVALERKDFDALVQKGLSEPELIKKLCESFGMSAAVEEHAARIAKLLPEES